MSLFFHKIVPHLDKLDAEALRRQYQRLAGEMSFYENIFNAMRDGVIAIDAAGDMVYANYSAGKLLGFNPQEMKGAPVERELDWIDWGGLLARPDTGGWERVARENVEVTYPEKRSLELSGMPRDDGGALILVRDVTAESAAAESALQSGREDAVRDLAAGVAHEIGNPLNALNIHLQLLERRLKADAVPPDPGMLLQDVQVARSEVKRLDSILKQFLSALRPAKPVFTAASLADPLKETLAILKGDLENRGITVTLDLPPSLPPAMIDISQMKQVFFNLIKNSMEALNEGGGVTIALSFDDDFVKVDFSDNGPGIEPERLAHIFEPYHTTKKGGSGLGLMVCRRIVRDHGGEIDVESKQAQGTRFTVRIPRKEKRIRRLT